MKTCHETAPAQRPLVRAVWLALGAPLLLAACAQLPDWQGKAPLQGHVPAALGDTASAAAMDWPQDHWWQRYGDAQLNALIDEALQGAPDMAAAAARVSQAQAMLGVSESATAPQLSAHASATSDKLSYNHLTPAEITPRGMNGYGRATLDLSWSLDLWGKHRAAIAAANGELQARQADAAQSRLLLASSVATAYADLVRLGATERTLAQSVQVRSTTAQLFAQRFEHGLENKGSVHSASARLAAARAEWLQAQEQVALQRHRIAALMGATPDRGNQIALPESTLQQPWQQQWAVPANLPANLLGRRPDVVAARLQAQALESRVAAKQAEFYPDVNLSAMVGAQSLGLPLQDMYVDANFKEVQLPKVRTGQTVELHADLYGKDVTYTGTVVGFSGGSGAAFAAIPAQNATGNWIKVVQRLPVRIQLNAQELAEHPLRVGLSMTATVDTRSGPAVQ